MSTGVSYRPIAADEFRVVHLLPASPEDNDNGEDDEVWCLLETRSSSLKTQYEALSYQWGDETVTRPIHIAHLSLPSATTSTRPGTQEEGTDRTGITARIAAAAVVYMVAPCQQSLSQAAKRIIPRPVRLGAAAVARRLNLWHCLRALAWLAVTAASWSFLSPPLFMDGATVTLDQQQRRRQLHVSWDKVYLLVVCMINGAGVVSMTIKTFQLLAEVWRTKPWLLGSRVRIGHDIVAHFHRFRKDRKRQGGGVGGSDMQDADDDDDTIGKSRNIKGRNRRKSINAALPKFETCEATTNLVRALKHLRRKKGIRTLWIDALCINQRDLVEKQVQIRRMGWVYANASSVVVWLGDYHGTGGSGTPCGDNDDDDGDENDDPKTRCGNLPAATERETSQKGKGGGGPRHGCQHEQQIQAAFKFIKSMSGMRLLYAALFMPRRDRHAQLQTARPGLLDIARRGWWERLWVLQEVALATGPVQIQCGRTTCEFGKFVTGHLRILEDLGEDKNNMYGDSDNNNNNSNKALIKALGPSRRLLDAVRDFRYSYLKEREGPLFKTAYGWMSQGLRRLMGDTSKKRTANFHEQPFADRLQRVLLRTAGRFRCRDGRDRLYGFMEFTSDFNSSVAVVQSMQYFVPAESASASGWFGATCAALVGAHLVWDAFYTADAKHWTISRPEYVVTKNKKFSNTFADASERQTPAEFFTTLARFLAQETQSLAFLDASPCGKPASGSREDIPSWVPDWAREVDHAAYENASRAREDDEARDIFQFIDEGKTLELVGRPLGKVKAVKSLHAALVQSSSWSCAMDKYLALPKEGKGLVERGLRFVVLLQRHEQT
ncbi:hypothetical protein PG989_005101 [Apiospora arundinis]